MVLERNFFVEEVLPTEVLRGLSDEEMAVYRRPYLEPRRVSASHAHLPARGAGGG